LVVIYIRESSGDRHSADLSCIAVVKELPAADQVFRAICELVAVEEKARTAENAALVEDRQGLYCGTVGQIYTAVETTLSGRTEQAVAHPVTVFRRAATRSHRHMTNRVEAGSWLTVPESPLGDGVCRSAKH
jgi:hypothetical protein